jgi:hypothetical protein
MAKSQFSPEFDSLCKDLCEDLGIAVPEYRNEILVKVRREIISSDRWNDLPEFVPSFEGSGQRGYEHQFRLVLSILVVIAQRNAVLADAEALRQFKGIRNSRLAAQRRQVG